MKKFLTVIILLLVVIGAAIAGYAVASRGTSDNQSVDTPVNETVGSKGVVANYSGKGLRSFPKEALNNTSTTHLNLSNNNLTGALPSEIQKLTKLEQLDVSNNNMTGIPAEVGQLRRLKVLNYANNQITGLPNEIGNLTQLEVFDLTGNSNVSQADLAKIRAKLTNTQIKY